MNFRPLLYLPSLLLSGCTIIGPHATSPEGWPELKVSYYKSSFWGVQRFCSPIPILVTASACAHIDLNKGTCDIYSATLDENVLEHEAARCQGKDAIGSSYLADLYTDWKARQ